MQIDWSEWSEQDIATLKRRYPHTTTAELAAELGRSPKSISNKALQFGLRKSPQQRAASNITSGRAAAKAIGDMAALGSKGGKAGGPARAKSLTRMQRTEIARKAIQARWAKKDGGEPAPRASGTDIRTCR